jgi:glycosyltransferase involved in cell wall biosynthesis
VTAGARVLMLVTNDVSRDARVRKEATSLAGAGYDVRVVGVGTGAAGADAFRLSLVAAARDTSRLVKPLRILANIRENRAIARRMLLESLVEPFDIIHANDLDTLPVGVALARRTGARLVYDAHELSSEAVDLHPMIASARRRREARLVVHADTVITVNTLIAEEMANRYGIPLPTVVYNGASRCEPMAVPVHEPVRLLFQGQFFADRNLEELVHAMPLLKGRAVLTLQGWGGVEAALRALVQELRLAGTVVFAKPAEPEDVVIEAAAHDVGIINHLPLSLNHVYSSPNKLFDYMAAGLAIVASDLPVLRLVIEDAACGVLHPQAGPEALAEVIGRLVEDRETLARLKANAVSACRRYSWEAQSEVLVEAYASMSAARAKGAGR